MQFSKRKSYFHILMCFSLTWICSSDWNSMNIQVNSIKNITFDRQHTPQLRETNLYPEIDSPIWTRPSATENAGVKSAMPNPASKIRTQAALPGIQEGATRVPNPSLTSIYSVWCSALSSSCWSVQKHSSEVRAICCPHRLLDQDHDGQQWCTIKQFFPLSGTKKINLYFLFHWFKQWILSLEREKGIILQKGIKWMLYLKWRWDSGNKKIDILYFIYLRPDNTLE